MGHPGQLLLSLRADDSLELQHNPDQRFAEESSNQPHLGLQT